MTRPKQRQRDIDYLKRIFLQQSQASTTPAYGLSARLKLAQETTD